MLFARARQQQIAQSKKSQKADNSISGKADESVAAFMAGCFFAAET
jgi:hypothetical protein